MDETAPGAGGEALLAKRGCCAGVGADAAGGTNHAANGLWCMVARAAAAAAAALLACDCCCCWKKEPCE